jgi:CheY-like chemotaxis protein
MHLLGTKVLLVEAHADSLEAFSRILEGEGAMTGCASTVEEALQIAERLHPDVLVAELMMEGSANVVADVRRLAGDTVRAIAVCSHPEPRDYDRALAWGFQLFLPKPIDPDVLVTVVRRVTPRSV